MNSNVCFLDEATYNKVKVARLNSMLLRICLFTQVWNIHQPCSSLPTLCASPPHESALLISSHGTHSYLRNTAAARLRSSWPRGATQSLTINCWSLPLSLRTVLGLCHAGAKQARKPCLQSEDILRHSHFRALQGAKAASCRTPSALFFGLIRLLRTRSSQALERPLSIPLLLISRFTLDGVELLL